MLARGRGHVVHVASVAGHVPVGGEALYAATKAAVVSLAGGLRQELHGSPVRVTLVSPGVVDTPIFENRGLPYQRARPRPIPAARAAAAIVRGVERDARLVVVPWWLHLPVRLHGVAPGLYERMAARWG
jgi:short-subunit dehydrogenase